MKIRSKISIIIIVIMGVVITTYSIAFVSPQLQDKINPNQVSLQIKNAENFELYQNDEHLVLIDGAKREIKLTTDTNKKTPDTVKIPVNRVIVFSSTHAAFMDRLGDAHKIVGVTEGRTQEWFIQSIKSGLEKNTIKDIGLADNPNYDEIVALNPDLVILMGGTGLWEEHGKKLEELGIPYVVNSEWLESDPLGKFEWIKFFGVFTQKQDKASAIFDDVSSKTEAIFEIVSEDDVPDVIWAGVFSGVAYVPQKDSYVGQTIKMSNSNYVFNDIAGTGSTQIGIEELLVRGKDADILVYSSDIVNTIDEIVQIHPILVELGPIQKCNVYSFQPWYWQSIDKYDQYANDIAAITHPEKFANYELQQFKKLDCV